MYCLTNSCCICFYKKRSFKHLSDTDNDNITYYVKLTSCVPEMCFNEINEQRLVCDKCCETMNTVYNFRQTCLRSKTKLTDYISQVPRVSDVPGVVNEHSMDIKQECENENEIEQIYLFTDVEKYHNEAENSKTKSAYTAVSCKLVDNRSNNDKMMNIKMKNEDQITQNTTKTQDGFKIGIMDNDIELVVNQIKTESENQDITECLLPNFDNILTSCGSKNMDTKIKLENHDNFLYLNDCNKEEFLINQDEMKIDIVDHDIELFDNNMNGEINIQSKNKNIAKLTKENRVNATALDPNFYYKTSVEEKLKNSVSNKISKIEASGINNSKDNKITHLRINATEEKPYECSVCKKKFKQVHALKIHMRIHTDKRPYECNVCNKKFRQKGHLNSHSTIHTEKKPYECNVCEKKFRQTSDLKTHMRIHTGEKPYECSVCKNKFRQTCDLKIHMRIHTGEKPYKCNVCEKKFKQTGELNIHMRIHTGERPYECSVCKKKFRQTGDLKSHMIIHTGEKPYECSVCKRNFNQSHNLRRHMRIHNAEKVHD